MFPVLTSPLYEVTPEADAMRRAVRQAIADAHLSHKAVALTMGIPESQLARQLAGEPGTHLSLWRLASLPEVFWDAFDARRAAVRGALLISPELVALLRGAAVLKRAALKATLRSQNVERVG